MKLSLWMIILSLFHLPVTISAQEKEDMSQYLKSTYYIDCDNPTIIKKAAELRKGCNNDVEKVKTIFEYVRDSYNDYNQYESYKASVVLESGGNNCIQRSILQTALCRAAGVPARLHLLKFTKYNFKYDNGKTEKIISPHVITEIYINNFWHLYEATGNVKKWNMLNQDVKYASEAPIQFFPDRDCIFKSNENILFEDSQLYFADYSELMVKIKK